MTTDQLSCDLCEWATNKKIPFLVTLTLDGNTLCVMGFGGDKEQKAITILADWLKDNVPNIQSKIIEALKET